MYTNDNLYYKQMNYMNDTNAKVRVANKSSFNIIFKLKYSVGGKFSYFTSPNITPKFFYIYEIPSNATLITLSIFNNFEPSNPFLIYTTALSYARNACYQVSGSGSTASCKEVPCLFLGSDENNSNNCCCCCMCYC